MSKSWKDFRLYQRGVYCLNVTIKAGWYSALRFCLFTEGKDAKLGRVYYYHPQSGKSQWTQPSSNPESATFIRTSNFQVCCNFLDGCNPLLDMNKPKILLMSTSRICADYGRWQHLRDCSLHLCMCMTGAMIFFRCLWKSYRICLP